MWQALRSIADSLGVGFLAMQLIKLIGMVFSLVGPLKLLSGLFEGIFPLIANFFKFNFGWSINGMDIMAVAMMIGGTLIVWSSVARTEPMKTRYIFRFLMIPYALLVIIVAIIIQVSTPVVELNKFNADCRSQSVDASFYGSSCGEMDRQLSFWDEMFGDQPVATVDDATALEAPAEDETDLTGVSFILALLYLSLVLPLIAIVAFFFKRLSVNKLLRRVVIASGSAIGLAVASWAFAGAMA